MLFRQAELIRISEEAKLPAQISHVKLGSVAVWGKTPELIRLVESARRRGLDLTADCYLYDAWSSTIYSVSRRHVPAAVRAIERH